MDHNDVLPWESKLNANQWLIECPEPISSMQEEILSFSIQFPVILISTLGFTIRWERTFRIIFQLNNLYFIPWCTPVSVAFWNEMCLSFLHVWERNRERAMCRPVSGTQSNPSAKQYSQHTSDLHLLFKRDFIYSANVHVCLKMASLQVLCVKTWVGLLEWGDQMCAYFLVLNVDYLNMDQNPRN